MGTYLQENPWVYAIIAAGCLIVMGISSFLIFLCCKRKRESYPIIDENSSLLTTSYNTLTIPESTGGGLDHAIMSCQIYIREKTGMVYLGTCHQQITTATKAFYFMAKVENLGRRKHKTLALDHKNRKCVVKVMWRPKMASAIKLQHHSLMKAIVDILLTVKDEMCPFIWPVVDLKYLAERETLLVVNEYTSQGSVRDMMLGVKPFHAIKTENHKDSNSYDYSNPLTLEKIGLYAKQVLLGVIFLHKLGYPLQKCYSWLHAGNVMVKQGICMLSGFEIELLRIKSKDSLSDEANQRCGLNVVAKFIFEMSTGFPVNYTKACSHPAHRETMLTEGSLREIHFQYLRQSGKQEILQLLKFITDEDKCSSLEMSIYHPFFDRITPIQSSSPELEAIVSMNTLIHQLRTGMKAFKCQQMVADVQPGN